jgi:DHA1 family tetracycline resistance protein-like MFS transporter
VGALMYPSSAALAGDLADPAKRGIAMGGFNLFGSLGFAVGPFIGGVIAENNYSLAQCRYLSMESLLE